MTDYVLIAWATIECLIVTPSTNVATVAISTTQAVAVKPEPEMELNYSNILNQQPLKQLHLPP